MYLDTALMLAELSPPEDIKAERDGCGIEGIDVTVKFKDIRRPLAPCLTDEIIGEVLEDAVIAVGIGLRQIASGHMLAKSKMIALLVMCFYGDNQVAHTLAIAQLPEHQRKELVPTGEVLH